MSSASEHAERKLRVYNSCTLSNPRCWGQHTQRVTSLSNADASPTQRRPCVPPPLPHTVPHSVHTISGGLTHFGTLPLNKLLSACLQPEPATLLALLPQAERSSATRHDGVDHHQGDAGDPAHPGQAPEGREGFDLSEDWPAHSRGGAPACLPRQIRLYEGICWCNEGWGKQECVRVCVCMCVVGKRGGGRNFNPSPPLPHSPFHSYLPIRPSLTRFPSPPGRHCRCAYLLPTRYRECIHAVCGGRRLPCAELSQLVLGCGRAWQDAGAPAQGQAVPADAGRCEGVSFGRLHRHLLLPPPLSPASIPQRLHRFPSYDPPAAQS